MNRDEIREWLIAGGASAGDAERMISNAVTSGDSGTLPDGAFITWDGQVFNAYTSGLRDHAVSPIDVDTDHGHYDVLPARESDNPPAGATHTVFHESGERVGYASGDGAWSAAWSAAGVHLGARASLESAAMCVAAFDGARAR